MSQARNRLEIAKIHTEPHDRRPFCEQAHYTAEYAISAVLVCHGSSPKINHDIGVLLDQAEESGETVPEDLRSAQMLTQFAGSGRVPICKSALTKTSTPSSGHSSTIRESGRRSRKSI